MNDRREQIAALDRTRWALLKESAALAKPHEGGLCFVAGGECEEDATPTMQAPRA